ncbi:hypothetical protein KVR01_006656 [Diaporthe batatas]|uniref:uncharacterized protein n=1 Tax=Diaporthe batatas TaxID=748121 RepID=UPI001D05293F|nr:uncharacterized protein KVR01_006656 [Diaporthe batatas]KAG8163359.1 hypothetical protein KVR01_006656 [Diaporthe batatas]
MSGTQVITRTRVNAAPGAPAPGGVPNGAPPVPANPDPEDPVDYTNRPNAPPTTAEAVPSAQWARWRLYKQRPDIQDKFPRSFPDVSRHLHGRLTAQIRDAARQNPAPPRFTERSIDELKGSGNDKYQPTQLGFAPLTQFYDEADRQNSRLSPRQRLDSGEDGDRIPSLWFERMSQDLFARVWDFCSETFGADNIEEDDLIRKLNSRDWTADWLDKLPREFIVLASQVARGDMTIVKDPKPEDPNNWEFMFLDKMSRVKLVVGVIAKLLENNVFNSLLVGATEAQKAALDADDKARAFLDNSYQRNRTRAETVRNYIQSNRAPLGIGLTDLFTDYFWNEVEGITMGILDILLPLINLLGRDMPDSPWPPLRQVHQRLHDIVAEAAYFTNGTRASRSVFWIQFPLPGEMNDISHEHAIDDIWKRSKRKALEYDNAESVKWETTRDAELAEQYPGQPITQEHLTEYETRNPRPFVRRAAKVQIAMWPFVKRYTPMRERDAGDGAYNSGEAITQIIKAQTVYYYGDDSDAVDLKERVTLSDHVKSGRWIKLFTTRAILFFVLVFVVLFLLLRPLPFSQDPGPIGDPIASPPDQKLQRSKTTTVGAATVRTMSTTETVVVEIDDEDGNYESGQRSKAPSVTRKTETLIETISRMLGRGQGEASRGADDGQKDYVSESSSYSESSSTNEDDSSTATGDGIAASISSRVERVADNAASVAHNVASGAEGAGASIASAKDKAATSIMSAADKAGSSIESVKEKVAESFTSGADRASETIASKMGGHHDTGGGDEEVDARRKAMHDSWVSFMDANNHKPSPERDSKKTKKKSTRLEFPAEEQAATSVETSTSGESKASKKASEGSEGRSTYEKSDATSVDSRIVSEEIKAETATVSKNEDGTITSRGVTTQRVATPSEKKKMHTTTVTIPSDYVIEVVRGPASSTLGSFTRIYQTVELAGDLLRFLLAGFRTWLSIWIVLVPLGYWLRHHVRRYPYATIGSALLVIGFAMGVLHIDKATHFTR